MIIHKDHDVWLSVLVYIREIRTSTPGERCVLVVEPQITYPWAITIFVHELI